MRILPPTRRPTSALVTAENGGDAIVFPASASIAQFPQATLVLVCKPASVANVLRFVWAKRSLVGGTALECFRRGVDGTQWRLQVTRATTNMAIDVTGITAGNWQYLAWHYDRVNSAGGGWRGLLGGKVVPSGALINPGAGTFNDDTVHPLAVGVRAGDTVAGQGMELAAVWYFPRILTEAEHSSLWQNPRSFGARLYVDVARRGRGLQPDRSGYGNHGAVQGTPTLAAGFAFGRARRSMSLLPALSGAGEDPPDIITPTPSEQISGIYLVEWTA